MCVHARVRSRACAFTRVCRFVYLWGWLPCAFEGVVGVLWRLVRATAMSSSYVPQARMQ